MQAPNSIYLKNNGNAKSKYSLPRIDSLLLSCLLVFFCLNACRPDTIWNSTLTDIQQKLKNADYTLIEQLAEKQLIRHDNLEESFRLGPHAPLYFYHILKKLGKDTLAEQALQLMLEKISSDTQTPLNRWQEESWQLLVKLLLTQKRYAEAEKWTTTYLKRPALANVLSGSDPTISDIAITAKDWGKRQQSESILKMRKASLEALYRQEKDPELLKAIKNFFPLYAMEKANLTVKDLRFKYEEEPELLLYWAVANYRTHQEEWPEAFKELFLYVNQPDLHLRTYKFLLHEPEAQPGFKPEVWDLLTGKYQLLDGEVQKGIPLLEKTLLKLDASELAETKIIKELAFAYLNTGRYSQGIRFFNDLLVHFTSLTWPAVHTRVLEAKEMLARLYRAKKNYYEALPLLREVAFATPDKKQRDRVLWFMLDMQIKLSPAKGLKEITTSFSLWDNAAYFYDLLDELIHKLTVSKSWNSLLLLYQTLTTNTDAKLPAPALEILDRLYYLVSYYYASAPDVQTTQVLKKHHSTPESNYYALLTAFQENRLQDLFPENSITVNNTSVTQNAGDANLNPPDSDTADSSDTSNKPDSVSALTEEEDYIKGFFDYGLFSEGFTATSKTVRSIQPSVLLEIIRLLQSKGYYYSSINLAYSYLARKGLPATADDYRLIYPRGFAEQIETLAQEWGLPAWLFYTLVWAESAYKVTSLSPAGAVGLAQLLPSTAQEMAGRLKLPHPDLNDPAANLRLGTYYYSRLYNQYESALKAFIAYNAGPARIRKWAKEFTRYPGILFAEAIPIPETRKYVSKIVHTAVLYAYLYYQQSPSQTIQYFYPSLVTSHNGPKPANLPPRP